MAFAGTSGVPAVALSAGSTDAENEFPALMMVVDASGSMADPSGAGGTRIAAAEVAFGEVVGAVPDDAPVGLRVFGGEQRGDASCDDTRLAVPVGPVDRPALTAEMAGLEPRGETPLADSIEAAAADLPDDRPGVIIVVTDGRETCGGDPCEVAGRLVEEGIDVRVDVVGFQVPDDEQEQLQCIADAGGGTYFDAPDADSLATQLQRAAVRGMRHFAPSGTPIEGTSTPQGAPMVEPDLYLDELIGDEPRHYQVDVPEESSLWVSATVQSRGSGLAYLATLEIEITSPTGEFACGQDSNLIAGPWNRLQTAGTVVTGEDLADCGEGPYTIRVEQGNDGASTDRPVELLVGFEPGVTTVDGLPAEVEEEDWEAELTTASAPVEPVTGSPNIASATVVEPGRYSDTIVVGETLFYGVELDWGQQLACEVTFAATGNDFAGNGPVADIYVSGPFRREMSDPTPSSRNPFYQGDEDVTAFRTTPPVRYLNREGVYPKPASVPGTYHCAVNLGGFPREVGAAEVPLEIVIDVIGTAGEGAPDYVADLVPTPTPTPTTDEGAEDSTASNSDGLPGWLPIVGAFVLGVLIAGVAVGFYRARNRARPSS